MAAVEVVVWLALAHLAAISIAAASQADHALRELCVLLGLLGVTTWVASLPFDKAARSFLLAAGMGSAAYAAIVFPIASIAVATGSNLVATELFFGYDSYRFYNHVQTVCLPLLVIVASSGSFERSARSVAWTGSTLGFALLFLSAGRATGLALFVASAMALMVFRGRAFQWMGGLLIACSLGALAYASLVLLLPWLIGSAAQGNASIQPADLTSDHARFYLWRLAINDIAESPWFGIGPMHFAHRLNPKAAHPHNVYLQVAAEWGLPMLLLLLALSFRALWRFSQRIRSCSNAAEQTMGVGLFAGCVAVAVDGFFSGNFVMPVSQMWIAFLFGLSIAWYRSQAPQEVEGSAPAIPPPKWCRAGKGALAAALVGSQLWLLYSVYPEATHLAEHLEQVQKDLAPNPRTNPRFWSHGWF